jgi:exopolyphosphatase/guanosine-5'-triphosphate,3'-diphosphate pyrophosphatase
MIAAHDWQSLKTGEVDLVAQIARYHRKAMPEPGHASFHALGRAGQEEVMLLGGILRVADALDRTHTGRIAKIAGAAVSDEALTIRVVPHGDWDAEREMFALKRNLLERVAERPVIVKAAEA